MEEGLEVTVALVMVFSSPMGLVICVPIEEALSPHRRRAVVALRVLTFQQETLVKCRKQ